MKHHMKHHAGGEMQALPHQGHGPAGGLLGGAQSMHHYAGHEGHHKAHHSHHSGHSSGHGIYKNQVEMPELAPMGHMEQGMGCSDFKGEADPIAMGQAGGPGCMEDGRKILSQFKDYHWD